MGIRRQKKHGEAWTVKAEAWKADIKGEDLGKGQSTFSPSSQPARGLGPL